MVDNQHQKISGYRDLSQEEIDAINLVKNLETDIGNHWRNLFKSLDETIDKRWMNIARTHFEEGFSAFVRAIAQPTNRF